MVRTRKIQVTLDEIQYDRLVRIARRSGKKLAGVVRESIEKYTLLPETGAERREALDELFSLPPATAPEDWQAWERAYSALKTKSGK